VLRGTTSLPIVLQGILHDDAERPGADRRSSLDHGGRLIDGASASSTPWAISMRSARMAFPQTGSGRRMPSGGLRRGDAVSSADLSVGLALDAETVETGSAALLGRARSDHALSGFNRRPDHAGPR